MFSATCSILHPIVSHTNSIMAARHEPTTPIADAKTQQFPRIKNLAPLCVLKVNLNIDEVSYTLLSNEDVPVTEALQDIFDTYSSHILNRGSFARVSHTSERLAIQRLRKFEVDVRAAELALKSICAAAEVSKAEASHVISRLVHQFSAGMPRLMNPAVIAYTFHGIHFSYYSLTYDSRTTFHIEEVLVSDHNSNPVVHLFCDSAGHYDSLSVNSKMKAAQKERGKNTHSSTKKKKLKPSQRNWNLRVSRLIARLGLRIQSKMRIMDGELVVARLSVCMVMHHLWRKKSARYQYQ
jgi:hypothetical protein